MKITFVLLTLVSTGQCLLSSECLESQAHSSSPYIALAAATDPVPTETLPQLDIIYNLGPNQIDQMADGFATLLYEGSLTEDDNEATCHSECFYFANNNRVSPVSRSRYVNEES